MNYLFDAVHLISLTRPKLTELLPRCLVGQPVDEFIIIIISVLHKQEYGIGLLEE